MKLTWSTDLRIMTIVLLALGAQSAVARDWSPSTAAELTVALDQCASGDTIILRAGTTYTGSFTLRAKPGADAWITVRSSALERLPERVRVSPEAAGHMPRICSPGGNAPAFQTEVSAHHYRLLGLEIVAPADGSDLVNLVMLGRGDERQSTRDAVPKHIVIDRCILRAHSATQNVRRGIALNSAYTDVTNSHLAGFKEIGADAQALGGWNGPGPFNIVNNFIEGAGENLLFGGADAQAEDLQPADITIARNHFPKPLSWNRWHESWDGRHWVVKNILELKNARNVVIEGNIFEHNWAGMGQSGFAIVLTPRNQDGRNPWASVEDVRIVNNIVRHSAMGVNLLGWDDEHPSRQLKRVLFRNNLFHDIAGQGWAESAGDGGVLYQFVSGTADVTIDHNTAFPTRMVIAGDGVLPKFAHTNLTYTNNLQPHAEYGIHGSAAGIGNEALNRFFPGATLERNVFVGGPADRYNAYPGRWTDPTLAFPPSWDGVLVDRENPGPNLDGWRVVNGSPYDDAGNDGRDIGCDIDELLRATAGCIAGTWDD